MSRYYKITFFCPQDAVEQVKQALFSAGAGQLGHYQKCCWQVLGQGQFYPNAKAQPAIGELEKLHVLPEYRVEMLCEKEHIKGAIAALKLAHPYEEPAFDVLELFDIR